MTRWTQFVALGAAQIDRRDGLRDIAAAMAGQSGCAYHLGIGKVSRSSLGRVNAEQPYLLYEALFGRLLGQLQGSLQGGRFRPKLIALDASLIDLSARALPWARYVKGKAAVKLHVGLDERRGLPVFAAVSDSRVPELKVARGLDFAPGSLLVFDKGYCDFGWFHALDDSKVRFVTRAKTQHRMTALAARQPSGAGVLADETVRIDGRAAKRAGLPPLRRVLFEDPESGRRYVFLTNDHKLDAADVAEVYRRRWQVELFFKWVKQNLGLRSFVGQSRNAVLTQIWVALCVLLLVAWLKHLARLGCSMRDLLRRLRGNLFHRRDLFALLRAQTPPPPPSSQQLAFI